MACVEDKEPCCRRFVLLLTSVLLLLFYHPSIYCEDTFFRCDSMRVIGHFWFSLTCSSLLTAFALPGLDIPVIHYPSHRLPHGKGQPNKDLHLMKESRSTLPLNLYIGL